MSELAPIVLTDPQTPPEYDPSSLLSRWSKRALHEPRDQVFVRLTLQMVALMPLLMGGLYLSLHLTKVSAWLPATLYLALWGYLVSPVILMLHNTMHRPFLKTHKWLDRAHPFAMSFLFGIPMGYREHHIGMHHAEDNMAEDLSSTLRYRRDSFLHFLSYFARFFLLSAFEVPMYLAKHKKPAMARRAVLGELAHTSIIAGALFLDWRFGAIAFLAPYVLCRFMMMVGNWGQHAFINVERKNSGIANSISCINSGYNQRCFNDGYHVGHHLRAARHWSEMPGDFLKNQELYAREGAIVFEGIDFFMVSVLLWCGQYRFLAKRFVRLGAPRSDAEIIAMLRERVKPVRHWAAEAIGEVSERSAA
jgi:fatty acid desaturase